MIHKKYFCYEIYKNLAVWSTANGRIGYSPCSYFSEYIKETDSIDIAGIWNSPERAALTNAVENDQPIAGCARCYQEEANGLVSRRMSSRNQYEIFLEDTNIDLSGPQGLDYSVGNLCNLKCVICGPHNSTSWIPDYQQLYPSRPVHMFKHRKNEQIILTDAESIKNITVLHLHGGGEPLLSNNHIRLLELLRDNSSISQLRVYYNTNGTARAAQSTIDLWSQCRLIELYFSIDDIGTRFEYQRTGASWNSVTENLEWYKQQMPHNHLFNINCTWGYLNFYYLPELVDWYQKHFSITRFGDNINLIFQKAQGTTSLDYVSTELYKLLEKRFENYPDLLALLSTLTIDDTYQHDTFWNEIGKIDAVRNADFRTLCPEWSKLI